MQDNLIRAARVSSGLTQESAAHLVGLSVPAYSRREKDPALFTIGQLCNLYTSIDDKSKKIVKDYFDCVFLLPK